MQDIYNGGIPEVLAVFVNGKWRNLEESAIEVSKELLVRCITLEDGGKVSAAALLFDDDPELRKFISTLLTTVAGEMVTEYRYWPGTYMSCTLGRE